ncbi:hypothetical protein QBC37DRAFT_376501 [Rhypophila decipiens]|uniref:Actin-like ATPase domain-containing protein n=1 Tax=Rhypophila decipiens TaxID=261697 RepID=A0AAN6Y217_9PEZI|nr:hypothetical protein QBC37DRAFT_376501 [Rhypophila decipiens]
MADVQVASSEERKKVTLGIDIGSVSSRAYLFSHTASLRMAVWNPSRDQNRMEYPKFEKGDFSSKCYPFDEGLPYLGQTTVPDGERLSTSLKYAPYVLVNCSDDILEQYMTAELLKAHQHDAAFQHKLRVGLLDLFKTIVDRVHAFCRNKMEVTEVVMTVPSQWTLEFEELYATLVSPFFNFGPSNVFFCTETEALANFLLRCCPEELEEFGDYHIYLFLDFGGHNMNGCGFEVRRQSVGNSTFCRINEPFGAGGGSEEWEERVANLCGAHFKTTYEREITPKQRQAYQADFSRVKVRFGPELCTDPTILHIQENGDSMAITIPKHEIDQAWEDAHSRVLALAAANIDKFANIPGACVVLSGGTSRHATIQSRITELCTNAGLPGPFSTDALLYGPYSTVNIAQGAAYAVGQRVTVREFFSRGAAIGIQMKQGGSDNEEGLWDDVARFVMGVGLESEAEIQIVDKGDELQLVCDPYRSQNDGTSDLSYLNCYVLLPLEKIAKGRYKFTCKLEDNTLVLTRWKTVKVKKGNRLITKIDKRYHYPVYFAPGANCVLIGEPGKTLTEAQIKGIRRMG